MDWTTLEDQTDQAIRSSSVAEPVIYTPKNRTAESIRGVLELNPVEVDLETGASLVSGQPRLGVRVADLSYAPAEGDEVEARGIAYRVSSPVPVGGGWVEMRLHRV